MNAAIRATPHAAYPKATKPTMYFIGVTTGNSSIMRVFPRWASYLKLGDVAMQGIDCKLHDDPATYRRVVEFIRSDPLSKGALVTSHKLDLLAATRDLFHTLDPFATLVGEISSISKDGRTLVGHAKDPITSGLALQTFLPQNYWSDSRAAMLLLGAGGSSMALSSYLMATQSGHDKPAKLIVTDSNPLRLEETRRLHQFLGSPVQAEYYHAPYAIDNDALVSALPPGSVVINATGLGKDRPGSPITDAAKFPERGYAWDFNYRGELIFLEQARRQQADRHLHVEDGWVYFLHGWTRVIAEVFHIDIPTEGPVFDELSNIARETR